MTLAIIGAGMAGLACAEKLKSFGFASRLFDKGRGPGGRMLTRAMAFPLGDASFDIGAQYFTVRNYDFRVWCCNGSDWAWPPGGQRRGG